MAILKLEDGSLHTSWERIGEELADLKVQLNLWPIDSQEIRDLLTQPSLSESEKEAVLTDLDPYFKQLQPLGYQSRDLIVLHPGVPDLELLLSKFDRAHTHSDDEVRYIIEGEGVFGFVRRDGSQVELTVQAEEYIHVPAQTEHWFYLTEKRRIKAVRYFTGVEGWVPQYTDRAIRFRQVLA